MTCARLLLILVLAPCLNLGGSCLQAQSADAAFTESIQPFLSKNCQSCHNQRAAAGKLDLETFAANPSFLTDQARWEAILHRVEAGEMPPQGMPRPDSAEIRTLANWIRTRFEVSNAAADPNPGRVTARRLNRTEYNNTIRDLLGIDFHPADDFPQDDSGYGFDNIADVLSVSPTLTEMYLKAAEGAVKRALYGVGKIAPTAVLHQPPYRAALDGGDASRLGAPPYTMQDYDLTGLSLPSALHVKHTFPVAGVYEFRISPEGNRPRPSDPFDVVMWIDGKQAHTYQLEAVGFSTSFEGQDTVFQMPAPAGEHDIAVSVLRVYEGLPEKYGGPNPTKLPPLAEPPRRVPPPLPADATPEQKAEFEAQRRARAARANRPPRITDVNFRFNFIRISGPFEQDDSGPSEASLQKIFTCGHLHGDHNPSCARKIMSDFAGRAFRRPVAPVELEALLGLVSEAQARGETFDDSIAVALKATLISPHFLFRIERGMATGSDGGVRSLTAYELAARLSYFLWSTTPDAELLQAAASGTLNNSDGLNAQVLRMLRDPRSGELAKNFGGQWLQFRALESASPDPLRFPYFNDYLRQSMQTETELFLQHLIQEDLSVLDLLDGKYSYLNESLARHYKIKGVDGPEFRRVDLSGTHRSGVITQASVLTASSYATRTSVVLRGKWIMENILNTPVPPPPPDVPILDEAATGTSASLRQQMEAHRANAVCASCHARMDPLGFGMENYDAIGQWRTEDGKFPIDPSGTLPSGENFSGPDELKALLVKDPNAFTEGLTEKLLIYALGRGLEGYDQPVVEKIAQGAASDGYRFSGLVLRIVNSLPFRNTQGD
jgi:mono/diheme cytochrome c family protein